MIIANHYEEIAQKIDSTDKTVLIFTADWCGDCRYLHPLLPDIEKENPDFTFILVDRDRFIELAQKWDVFGIPSLLVFENGVNIASLINKERKTKQQINEFLKGLQ